VRLDRERHTRGRSHRSAEEDVVDEQEVGRKVLTHRSRIALDVRVQFLAVQVLQEARSRRLVGVEHEDRQVRADVRAYGEGAAQVVALGVPLLAEHDHLVALLAPGAGE
jgi:hypothetical protein